MDFLLTGTAEADANDMRLALCPNNCRRNLLRQVLLCSNNARVTSFVLVGGVKDAPFNSSVQAAAAWLRNRRRTLAAAEANTNFVLLGRAEVDGEHRHVLLPQNHKRTTLRPVLLTSDNNRVREYTDFILVGPVVDVPAPPGSAEAQAAWLRNHRRALREQLRAAKALARDTRALVRCRRKQEHDTGRGCRVPPRRLCASRLAPGIYDCSFPLSMPHPAVPHADNRATAGKPPGANKEERGERVSSDSIMSLL